MWQPDMLAPEPVKHSGPRHGRVLQSLTILRCVQEEREERALRQADMEAQKATNMMEHEAEIAQRPARTWFQTPREKEQVRCSIAAAHSSV